MEWWNTIVTSALCVVRFLQTMPSTEKKSCVSLSYKKKHTARMPTEGGLLLLQKTLFHIYIAAIIHHTGGAKEIRTHIIIIFFTSRAHYDRAFLL